MRQINEKLKEKCGIYIITNINNGNRYVGSSKNMFNRLRDHIWDLQSNRHINSHLQNAWNKYGEENFEYGILCICTEEEKLNKEQFFIDKLSPEYNLDFDVKHITRSENTKEKISTAIKEKYENGWTNATYKDPVYIYNINTWKLELECKQFSEAGNFFYGKSGSLKMYQLNNSIIKDCFVVLSTKFKDQSLDLINYVSKNILNYKTQDKRTCYLIIEDSSGLHYFKTAQKAVDYMKCCSVSTIKKHNNSTRENPYIIPNTTFKMYMTNEYIPVEDKASI
jgi:group I intron endonuclease|nr:MAG TPA: intron associated endonuclease [Crassvirales sp.]